MTTPSPNGRPTAITCSPAQVGPCVKCQEACCRYGPGGNPLCLRCQDELAAWVAAEKQRQRG